MRGTYLPLTLISCPEARGGGAAGGGGATGRGEQLDVVFIERSPTYFKYVVAWLHLGFAAVTPEWEGMAAELEAEASYYCLPHLRDMARVWQGKEGGEMSVDIGCVI